MLFSLVAALSLVPIQTEGFPALVARCAPSVHLTTISAVVRHESAYRPLVIGLNHTLARLPRQPATKAEAVATAQWLDARGYNFDSGLGQVNSKNRAWLGMSYDDLFDPCSNLRAAARILTDCYQRAQAAGLDGQPALHGALSCYATGNLRSGISNGYVKSLANMAVLPVPALLGGTPPSRPQPGAPTPSDGIPQPKPPSDTPPVEPQAKPARHNGEPDVFGRGDGEVFAPPVAERQGDSGAPPH